MILRLSPAPSHRFGAEGEDGGCEHSHEGEVVVGDDPVPQMQHLARGCDVWGRQRLETSVLGNRIGS